MPEYKVLRTRISQRKGAARVLALGRKEQLRILDIIVDPDRHVDVHI